MQTIMQVCHTEEQRKVLPACPCASLAQDPSATISKMWTWEKATAFSKDTKSSSLKTTTSCIWALPFPKRVIFPPAQPLQQALQQMPAPEGQGWEGTLSCRCSNAPGCYLVTQAGPGRGCSSKRNPTQDQCCSLTANTARPVSKRSYLLS